MQPFSRNKTSGSTVRGVVDLVKTIATVLDVLNYRQECFSQAETSTMEPVGIFCNLGNITAVGVNDCVVSMHLYGGVTS